MASIAQSIELGTYRIAAEDIASAIMSGPFVAHLRRMSSVDLRWPSESPQRNDDH
ncbi:MAG: hypothetical protein GY722_27035 [bacterium]|nr:hypothetical protein [bacterium]